MGERHKRIENSVFISSISSMEEKSGKDGAAVHGLPYTSAEFVNVYLLDIV